MKLHVQFSNKSFFCKRSLNVQKGFYNSKFKEKFQKRRENGKRQLNIANINEMNGSIRKTEKFTDQVRQN